jgi:hypothetical protein
MPFRLRFGVARAEHTSLEPEWNTSGGPLQYLKSTGYAEVSLQ